MYKPSLQDIANTKTLLAGKGVYWNDARIEAYLVSEHNENKLKQADEGTPMPSDFDYQEEEPAGIVENTLDAVGSALWSALDTGTFGLTGLAMEKAAPET